MTNSDGGGPLPRLSVFGAGARIVGIWIFGLIGSRSLFAILGERWTARPAVTATMARWAE
jgi:hypothetical protein